MRLLNIPKPLDMDTMPLRGADTSYIYIARSTPSYRHWNVRVKFLGVAGRIGVVADQETNWFKLLFVPSFRLMSSVLLIVS